MFYYLHDSTRCNVYGSMIVIFPTREVCYRSHVENVYKHYSNLEYYYFIRNSIIYLCSIKNKRACNDCGWAYVVEQ